MNQFVWADLSTFDVEKAKTFYGNCLHWQTMGADGEYQTSFAKRVPVAGLYDMPQKFQDMGMPSFWMSYIQVEDVAATVENARALGAKVEVSPQASPMGGNLALIRDPAGAGFTLYQSDTALPLQPQNWHGGRVLHELNVSDLAVVEGFYYKLFGWRFVKVSSNGRYDIRNAKEQQVAKVQVAPNDVKGDKEYWGIYFAVNSLQQAKQQIEQSGGSIITELQVDRSAGLIAQDNQGAIFYLKEISQPSVQSENTGSWTAWIIGLLLVTIVAYWLIS